MSDSLASTSAPVVARPPLLSRILRTTSATLLALGLGLLLMVVAIARSVAISNILIAEPLSNSPGQGWRALLLIGAFLVVPLIGVMVALWRKWLTWPLQLAGWVVVIAGVGYLAADDKDIKLPLTNETFAPALPGDVATNQLVLRFAGQKPTNYQISDKLLRAVAAMDGSDKDADFLRQNQAEMDAAWQAIAPLRDWFDAMAAQPRLGDLTEDFFSPILPFAPTRTYERLANARAEQLALNGQGDAALAQLGEMLDVAGKLQANSRTLVRSSVVMTLQKMTLQRVPFVLSHAPTTPAARAGLAAVINRGLLGEAGVRRIVMCEYATFFQNTFLKMRLGDMLRAFEPNDANLAFCGVMNLLDPLLINHRASLNEAAAIFTVIADKAVARDYAGITALGERLVNDPGDISVKNVAGHYLLGVSLPAYASVARGYWQAQDLMHATLDKLNTTDAASGAKVAKD